jgi:hypothetical protein
MSMFDWQASYSSPQTISSSFWIYWAVTIPLTLIVAISWRLWWKWEKRNFDRDVRIEIEDIEEPKPWDSSKSAPTNQYEQSDGVQGLKEGWQSLHRRNKTQNAAEA